MTDNIYNLRLLIRYGGLAVGPASAQVGSIPANRNVIFNKQQLAISGYQPGVFRLLEQGADELCIKYYAHRRWPQRQAEIMAPAMVASMQKSSVPWSPQLTEYRQNRAKTVMEDHRCDFYRLNVLSITGVVLLSATPCGDGA